MRTNKIRRELYELTSKGWEIFPASRDPSSDSDDFYIMGPSGAIFHDRNIKANECCICMPSEDSPGGAPPECLGGHTEEDLNEQEEAYRFYSLLIEGRKRFDVVKYLKNIPN